MAKYYFKANIGALCKAREKVTALITSGNTSFKSVFAGEKSGVGGGWMLYLDEPSENWDNVYAVINEVKDEEGNLMDETDMRLIMQRRESKPKGLKVNTRIICLQRKPMTGVSRHRANFRLNTEAREPI